MWLLLYEGTRTGESGFSPATATRNNHFLFNRKLSLPFSRTPLQNFWPLILISDPYLHVVPEEVSAKEEQPAAGKSEQVDDHVPTKGRMWHDLGFRTSCSHIAMNESRQLNFP